MLAFELCKFFRSCNLCLLPSNFNYGPNMSSHMALTSSTGRPSFICVVSRNRCSMVIFSAFSGLYAASIVFFRYAYSSLCKA